MIALSAGSCLAALCRSEANRDGAYARETLPVLTRSLIARGDTEEVALAIAQCYAQLSLPHGPVHTPFPRPSMEALLAARARHPDSEALLHWLLSVVNNISLTDNDVSVWLGRQPSGLPMIMEARRLRTKAVFNSDGPGLAPADVCLAAVKAKLPR